MKNLRLYRILSIFLATALIFGLFLLPVLAVTEELSSAQSCFETIPYNEGGYFDEDGASDETFEILTQTLSEPWGVQGFEGDYALDDPNEILHIFVWFRTPSAVVLRLLDEKSDSSVRLLSEQEYESHAMMAHDLFFGELMGLTRGFSMDSIEITSEHHQLINGIFMRVPAYMVEQIAELDEVFAVMPNARLYTDLPEFRYIETTSAPPYKPDPAFMRESRELFRIECIHGTCSIEYCEVCETFKGENGITGAGVRVAVLDSGIDHEHRAFENFLVDYFCYECEQDKERRIRGRNFATCWNPETPACPDCPCDLCDPCNIMDYQRHGTHVSGSVVALAPDIELWHYKVTDNRGNLMYWEWLLQGITAAHTDEMDIINLSIACWGTILNPLHPINFALNFLVLDDIVVVTIAGNTGRWGLPINTPGTASLPITVASGTLGGQYRGGDGNPRDTISYFSSRSPVLGTYHIKSDIVAPGHYIMSTVLNGGYATASGTSMAAPHIAGIAALMRQAFPDAEPCEIKARMMNTARPLGTLQTPRPNPLPTYSVFTVGAGFVRPLEALRSETVVTVEHDVPFQYGILDAGEWVPECPENLWTWRPATMASLSFGDAHTLIYSHANSLSMEAVIRNTGITPRTYTIEIDWINNPGNAAQLTLSHQSIQVQPNQPANFTATMSFASDFATPGIHEGYINVKENGNVVARLPFGLVNVHPWDSLRNQINIVSFTPDELQRIMLPTNITVEGAQDTSAIEIPWGANITLIGGENRRTITQTDTNQRHFIIGPYASLTLDNNITLSGNANNAGGVEIWDRATFTMNAGSVIENCHWAGDGGAVMVVGTGAAIATRATFNLSGGTIRNNSATNGGGVHLGTNSHMTMTGAAIIEGNTATGVGDGVYLTDLATFNMTGGQIRNNSNGRLNQNLVRTVTTPVGLAHGLSSAPVLTANNPQKMLRLSTITLPNATHTVPNRANILLESSGQAVLTQTNNQRHFIVNPGGTLTLGSGVTLSGGTSPGGTTNRGGVLVSGGTFQMQLGSVIENNRASSGGGVMVGGANGMFTLSGGTIRGNTATGTGGGVMVNSGTFQMQLGSVIENNHATSGGGVLTSTGGMFTLSGGAIRGNTATAVGGGVGAQSTRVDGFRIIGDAIIEDNTAGTTGDGVHLTDSATFNMTAGQIRNNGTRNLNLVRQVTSPAGLEHGISSAPVLAVNNPQKMLQISSNVITFPNAVYTVPNRANIMLQSSTTANRTLTQTNNQRHFIVAHGGTLTLGSGVTLSGGASPSGTTDRGGVLVNGRFYMEPGSVIQNNRAANGGGVDVGLTGHLTLAGGAIRGNTATASGGGVRSQASHTNGFRITGAANIENNTAGAGAAGDGVYLTNLATFHMTAGQIQNNGARNQNLVRTVTTPPGLQLGINSAPVLTANNPQKMLRLADNIMFPPAMHTVPNRADILLQSSTTANRLLTQSNAGQRHFIVNGNLTLGQGTTLRGGATMTNTFNAGGVQVNAGGTFTMNAGSVIENCRRTVVGGAVTVVGSGTAETTRAAFNMLGGTIRNNSALSGGGVNLGTNSRMTMADGTIWNNVATGTTATNGGGGIFMNTATSTFTMTGGAINSNQAANGGGISQAAGTVNISNGLIIWNSATNGGGVHVAPTAVNAFQMTSGSITNNWASVDGGGIFTTEANHASTVPLTAYRNLNIGAPVIFSGNRAGGRASAPPHNAASLTHLQFAQASIEGHILNNYDINYTGRLVEISTGTLQVVAMGHHSEMPLGNIGVEIVLNTGEQLWEYTDWSGILEVEVPVGTHQINMYPQDSLSPVFYLSDDMVHVTSNSTTTATVWLYKPNQTFISGTVVDGNGGSVAGMTVRISEYLWGGAGELIADGVSLCCCGCFWVGTSHEGLRQFDRIMVEVLCDFGGSMGYEVFWSWWISFGGWSDLGWIWVWSWGSPREHSQAGLERFSVMEADAVESGVIHGFVRDKDDLPIAYAKVILICADTGDSVGQTTTDAYGFYRFDDVAPGRYSIKVTADDFLGSSFGFVDVTEDAGAALDAVMIPGDAEDVAGIIEALRSRFGVC